MKIQRGISAINVGDMIHQVELFSPTYGNDGQGNVTVDYTTDGTRWANVQPLRDSRGLSDAGLQFTEAVTIYLRYEAEISPNYRLTFDSKDFTIHTVEDVNLKRQFMQIVAYAKL